MHPDPGVIIRYFGVQDYPLVWEAMRRRQRQPNATLDHQIWFGEHPPVYTLGQTAHTQHLLNTATAIPICQSDRGGQITYHGPGQLMFYTLLNLRTLRWSIRQLVTTLENILITYLTEHQIQAHGQREAPGVYINTFKIASIGLRVSHGHSYHGLAINVAMDLAPFKHINPCGFANLQMTQLSDHAITTTPKALGLALSALLAQHMGVTTTELPWPQ